MMLKQTYHQPANGSLTREKRYASGKLPLTGWLRNLAATLPLLCLVATAASCSQENAPVAEEERVEVKLKANMAQADMDVSVVPTRAVPQTIGVYTYSNDGTRQLANSPFTPVLKEDGSYDLTSDNDEQLFLSTVPGSTLSIYAYGPRTTSTSTIVTDNNGKTTLKVAGGFGSGNGVNYPIWASATVSKGERVAQLDFKQIMANIKMTISDLNNKGYYLNSIYAEFTKGQSAKLHIQSGALQDIASTKTGSYRFYSFQTFNAQDGGWTKEFSAIPCGELTDNAITKLIIYFAADTYNSEKAIRAEVPLGGKTIPLVAGYTTNININLNINETTTKASFAGWTDVAENFDYTIEN